MLFCFKTMVFINCYKCMCEKESFSSIKIIITRHMLNYTRLRGPPYVLALAPRTPSKSPGLLYRKKANNNYNRLLLIIVCLQLHYLSQLRCIKSYKYKIWYKYVYLSLEEIKTVKFDIYKTMNLLHNYSFVQNDLTDLSNNLWWVGMYSPRYLNSHVSLGSSPINILQCVYETEFV